MKRVPFIILFAVSAVLACGPFIYTVPPVETIVPGNLQAYAVRGELGVVRPRFARRYLVQAFRRMTGHGPLHAVARRPPFEDPGAQDAQGAWSEAYQRVSGTSLPSIRSDRDIGDYQFIRNCLSGAYATAADTLNNRATRYGKDSPQVRDWIKAQDAVFHNCADKQLVLPDPAPASADAAARGDRDYQIAAAYFYAMRYDEAVQRFRRIAEDRSSPWRPYGHYLAARALLRQSTMAGDVDRARLADAEAEFRLVLQDGDARFLHASARGLLNRIALIARPFEHLRVLSTALSRDAQVDDQTLYDYEWVMDRAVGNETFYNYDAIDNRAELSATAEMNDWITVMQGEGEAATARAVAQWKRTQSVPWLAAALWKVAPAHPDGPALLQASTRVAPDAPAFFTIAFLRVRLLALRGQDDEARAVLATLPASASSSGQAPDGETINLLNAVRFKLARGMDELLKAAARNPMAGHDEDGIVRYASDESAGSSRADSRLPTFDDDAGIVFSARLPLARLVEAATSSTLPPRLRLRVASAAFVRAWLLKRHTDALVVAPILRRLSPSLADDMVRFEAAGTPDDRHVAGLRLLLRTPGLRANVKGIEDSADYASQDLPRDFDHVFRRIWWCDLAEGDRDKADTSQAVPLLYANGEVPYPAFLSKQEIAAVEAERNRLASMGPAPNYLAAEAVKWAKARPTDLDAAEALAHAVEGTRWGCGDAATTLASRAAFQTLHRLFPKTEWARRTKYWY